MFECPKCAGTGYIREYNHVAGGVCFLCNGKGTVDRLPRERKPRKQLTPEEKRAKQAKQERDIITSELEFADKRVTWQDVTNGASILARFADMRSKVNSVATARLYAQAISNECSRLNQLSLVLSSASYGDCAHWSDFCYSAD